MQKDFYLSFRNFQILFLIITSILVFYNKTEESILINSLHDFYIINYTILTCLLLNIYFKNKLFELFVSFFLIFYMMRFGLLLCNSGFSSMINERNLDEIKVIEGIRNLNYAIIYIFFSLIIFNTNIEIIKIKISNQKNKVALLIFSIALIFFITIYNYYLYSFVESLSFIFQIFFNIFNWATVPVIFIVTLLTYEINKKDRNFVIYSLIVFMLFFLTSVFSSGSKSGILFLIIFLYIAFYFSNILENKFIKYLIYLSPFFLIPSILLWIFGIINTELENNNWQSICWNEMGFYQTNTESLLSTYISLDFCYDYFKIYYDKFVFHINHFTRLIDGFVYRVGYLDFYLDKLIFEGYSEFINLNYYFKSYLDKITPGFDFFGVPLASRALYVSYFGELSQITQSEQMTIFAESKVLFGKFSIFYFLCLSLLIKLLLKFNNFIFSHNYIKNLANFYLIYFFFNVLTGFGLDTHIMELTYFYVIIFTTNAFLITINYINK